MMYVSAVTAKQSLEPGRGEAFGFVEEFIDTLFLRCAAT